MSIEQQLRDDLTAAIKARDTARANCIRMVNTKVMERRTAKGFRGEVDDALYLDVIGQYVKSLQKAIDQFRAAGDKGAQNAAELQAEVDYLAKYLPQPMSEDELRAAVREAIAAVGATDAKMAGRVVGAVMKAHKGRVDAADVKRIAEEELGG
ncbi:MAG: hypothetical protein D6689_17535 [Deltaproteobacteria bacterium]|nr:MAG: hypothetical protein D6689_17535 [Deltaproteobacteria bacterium]